MQLQSSLYARLYSALADLIPDFPHVKEGQSFFAPSRQADDMSIFCSIAAVNESFMLVEFANDQVAKQSPSPWMQLRVNFNDKTAELLAVEDDFRYEVIYSDSNAVSPRRNSMNLFALNWMNIFIHTQSGFTSVEQSLAMA